MKGGEMKAQEFLEGIQKRVQTLQDIQTHLWHYRDVKNRAWADFRRNNKSLEVLLMARLADLEATELEIAMVEMKIELRNYKNGL